MKVAILPAFEFDDSKIEVYLIIRYKSIIFLKGSLRAIDAVEVDLAEGCLVLAGAI